MEKIKEFLHIGGKDKEQSVEQESHESDLRSDIKGSGSVSVSELSGSFDPREIEQPAKEAIDKYKDEHPDKKINLTTTTTTTRSSTKDVSSTATINPFTETYTTTVTMNKNEAEKEEGSS